MMQSFSEYVQRQRGTEPKLWKAKKADVIQFWQNLKPGLPIQPDPVQEGHEGTRFHEDGIRITGSPQFINSIMSRLKDFLNYESNPNTKLDVEYRQLAKKYPNERDVFVFYAHVLQDKFEPK